MSNIAILNLDLGSVVMEDSVTGYQDDSLTVGATTTLAAGTILARSSATGKLIAFVKGGVTADNGIPKTVLTYEVANATGAPVNVAVRVPVSAKVNKSRLIIAADGDDSNVDMVVRDQLRDYGFEAIDVTERSILDNQ